MMTEHYDAIVIGAGQAGVPLARAFAEAGRRTALVEREHVGGTCVNVGCTPTKTMIASGRVAYLARRGADYGVGTGEVAIDMGTVRWRKRAIVDSFRGGAEGRLRTTEGWTCSTARPASRAQRPSTSRSPAAGRGRSPRT
jgi:pyruvate/2-oxoglutarate dehydrogenase complex dihydrolipoamide dehydrogenase (E3) component